MSENNLKEFPAVSPLKVTIIGSGLGGLAVALALRKQGIEAQIYEKARELRPIGAGLTLFPNGLNSLHAVDAGIVESLKSAGSQTRVVNLKKSTGEMVMQNPLTLLEKYGQPMLNIRWSRLQEILASALPPDAIHLNCRCIGFEQDDKGIEVCFDGGKQVQTDLLIGADGINSAIRHSLMGDGFPNYAGRLSWRAVVKYHHEQLYPDESTFMIGDDGKNFTLIDVGGGYVYWAGGALSADENCVQSAAEVKSRVFEVFAGWAEPVQAIVEATPANDIVERPIYDRPPLQKWSKGKVTLLGDAAHPVVPVLGQGANTAFEDAWELAQFLSQSPNIQAALASYEKSRIPRTQAIQARSAFQGDRSYDTDSDIFLRDALDVAKVNQSEFEEWLYNYKP
ncbi:NAD(P)/FAD-dependent oxidoreductase [Scytonema sp. NUACC21]